MFAENVLFSLFFFHFSHTPRCRPSLCPERETDYLMQWKKRVVTRNRKRRRARGEKRGFAIPYVISRRDKNFSARCWKKVATAWDGVRAMMKTPRENRRNYRATVTDLTTDMSCIAQRKRRVSRVEKFFFNVTLESTIIAQFTRVLF